MGNSLSEELVQSIKDDSRDRANWEERLRLLEKHRMSERKRNTLYRNAPNLVDPIIDDNVRDAVSQEMSMMFGSRQLANFCALSQTAVMRRRDAEQGFDSTLRMLLGFHKKMENALDNKRSKGMAIIQQVENTKAYRKFIGPVYREVPMGDGSVVQIEARTTLPDVDIVSPYDFIVPTATKGLQDAERICHIHRYSERKLKYIGERRSWSNVDKVIRKCKSQTGEDGQQLNGADLGMGEPLKIVREEVKTNLERIEVWEVYHYDKEGKKKRTILSPACPESPLHTMDWVWLDTGEERDWPYVQLRNENRSLYFYDTRGDAELLLDNQKAATAHLNGKHTQMDYWTKPVMTGAKKAGSKLRIQPGDYLPEGTNFAQLPRVDSVFDFSADAERAKAARRSGASQGGFAGGRQRGTDKTATQVNAESLNSTRQVSVSSIRDGCPLTELYCMMWEWLRHNKIELPMFDGPTSFNGMMSTDIFDEPFIVQAASNSQNANPDFVLQQIMALGPVIGQNQFVKQDELARVIIDQINPQLTDRLVVPTQGGVAPIEQQVAQMGQMMQQMGQQVNQLTNYARQQAEADLKEAEEQQQMEAQGGLRMAQ